MTTTEIGIFFFLFPVGFENFNDSLAYAILFGMTPFERFACAVFSLILRSTRKALHREKCDILIETTSFARIYIHDTTIIDLV